MPRIFQPPTYTETQLETIDERQLHFPFNDKWLRYDGLQRKYYPTEALLVANRVRLDGFNEEEIKEILERTSDQIYTYINKRSGSTIDTLKWIIARGFRHGITPFRFRKTLEEVFWKQAEYLIKNGDLDDVTGVDLGDKQYVNKGVMRIEDRSINPKVRPLLESLGLAWAGSYDEWLRGVTFQEDW